MNINLQEFQSLDKSTPVPLYFQLKQQILSMVESGKVKPGDLLPPENDLSETLGISRPTVRQAFAELVLQGYLERKKAKGTFVSKPKIDARFLTQLKTFNEEMEERGFTPSSKMLSIECVEECAEICGKLGLPENSKLIYMRRIRYANSEPIVYQETHFSYDRFSELLKVNFSNHTLYQELKERYDVYVNRVEREIEAVNADEEEAELLQMEPNEAITMVRTIAYAQETDPIEYTISHYRGNRIKFNVELRRQ